jgi:threonine/homoserine/homoserine lactone efflux protein
VTAALLAGIAAGLGVAMPVGAITTLIALLSAQHGWRVGAAAGLGAATVDGAYATVAVLSGALIAPVLTVWRTPLRWTAVAVLVVIAVLLLRPAWQPAPALADDEARRADEERPSTDDEAPPADDQTPPAATTPRRAYATFLGLTAVNPTTIVYFAALTTGAPAGTVAGGARGAAFVVGAFAASAAWQLVIASAGHGAGRALTGPRGRRWTAIVGAAIVVGLAARTALGA